MQDESKTSSLTASLTNCFIFLRVRSSELYDFASRSAADFLKGLSKSQRIVLKATVTCLFVFLFVYAWIHSGPPEYYPSGKRKTPWTLPLGLVLLSSVISLLGELRGKE